eukprot:5475514-Amphidinium_carterae.1
MPSSSDPSMGYIHAPPFTKRRRRSSRNTEAATDRPLICAQLSGSASTKSIVQHEMWFSQHY